MAGKQDYREKFKLEDVESALRAAGGVQNKAAEMLGTNRSTIHGYIERYPHLKRVISEAKETTLDIAEDMLIKKIKDGNMAAIIFYLKTQGKARGYLEKADVRPQPPERPDYSKMTDEEIEAALAGTVGKPVHLPS